MNAKQLRDSILQYAFQGKLVNPKDVSENAIKLVEAIIDERNQLIKEKIIKKVKISTIKDTDYLWDIPEHWVWERAANVLDVRDGTHDTPKYVPEGIPLVTSKNLNNGEISFESAKFISMEDHLAIEQRSKVDNDDILFAMIGTIGNPVLVKKDRDFSVKNVGIFKSYPVNKVNMKYILYFLIYMENILKKNASGGVQAFISLSGLRDLMIPIAPIKEQNEIVSKVEELLEKVNRYDELYVHLEKHNMNFPNNLEKSILQFAMQGKLVSQDQNDGSVRPLIEKIQLEKETLIREKLIKKENPLAAITEEEIPFDIPSTWQWVRLGDISTKIHYGYTASAAPKGNAKLLRITDIQNNSVNWEDVPYCSIDENKLESMLLKERDILIARTGGTIGKSFLIKEVNGCSVFASYLIRVQLLSQISEDFISYYLRSPLYWNQLIEMSAGTGQPNVNAQNLKLLLVPLPPLKEQDRIVKAIEKMLDVKNKLK